MLTQTADATPRAQDSDREKFFFVAPRCSPIPTLSRMQTGLATSESNLRAYARRNRPNQNDRLACAQPNGDCRCGRAGPVVLFWRGNGPLLHRSRDTTRHGSGDAEVPTRALHSLLDRCERLCELSLRSPHRAHQRWRRLAARMRPRRFREGRSDRTLQARRKLLHLQRNTVQELPSDSRGHTRRW